MPGIPRTKRCGRCRHRRIKCDEDWPTCASCKRSNVVCSGPPTGSKFVHYNKPQDVQHETANVVSSDRSTQLVTSDSNFAAPRTVSLSTMSNGSSMSSFRLSSTPRSYPTTESDRVAGKLITHLEKSPTQIRQFLLGCNYLQFLPARVGHCAALRDCVALFASAWGNFQRGLPYSEVTNQRLYSKALYSLRRVLCSTQPFTSEALAAISILERFEMMFDPGRPLFWSSHRDGMIAIMSRRGPPKLDDKMSVWLALDSHGVLAMHWLVRGGHNFYEDEEWKEFMEGAITSCVNGSGMRRNVYRIEHYMSSWSSLVQEMRQIGETTEDDSTTQAQARGLHHRANALAVELDHLGGSIFNNSGNIVEAIDTETPVGAKYDFIDMDTGRCFVTYTTLRIVLNRIIRGLHLLCGERAPLFLDVEHRGFCRNIWMCLPYVRNVSLMAAMLFGDPLCVSYEGASGTIKEYLLTWLIEVSQFRKRLPADRAVLDKYILDSAMAFTGRSRHRERPDFPYWKLRSGDS